MKTLFVFANKSENQIQAPNDLYETFICGMGEISENSTIKYLSDKRDIGKIINLGICGCVNNKTPLYSIFNITESIFAGNLKSLNNSERLKLPVLKPLNFINTSCATSNLAINKPEQVEYIKSLGGFIFDMETYYLKRACKSFNIPFYSVKIVTDHGKIRSFNRDFRILAKDASRKLCDSVLSKLFLK